MFLPTQACLKIVVWGSEPFCHSLANHMLPCRLNVFTPPFVLDAHLKIKSRGSNSSPRLLNSRQPVIFSTRELKGCWLVFGGGHLFVCLHSAATADAISCLFICYANTANMGFTAKSACLYMLVLQKANFTGFHRPFLHVQPGVSLIVAACWWVPVKFLKPFSKNSV